MLAKLCNTAYCLFPKFSVYYQTKNIPENRFLQTYLIKIFQKLRKHDFSKLIEDRIDFHKELGERHKKKYN